MKSHLCLVIGMFLIFGLAPMSQAQEATTESGQTLPLVEVFHAADFQASFQDRRETTNWMFGLNYQHYTPSNYLSALDLSTYGELFGSQPIQMGEISLAYKKSFSAGSVTAGLGYGMGSVNDDRIGENRGLEISKLSFSGTYILDTIFSDPYVVPYVTGQIWRMSVKESSKEEDFSADSSPGFAYGAGLLILLNKLDPAAGTEAAVNWGVNNTYLDVFVTKYTQTQDSEDPDTANAIDYGAGLKFEF